MDTKTTMIYYGEADKYVRETFFPNTEYGTMVEVGAGPPHFLSMSKHFRDSGWRCICIDPIPKFVEAHKKLGHEIHNYACSDKCGESEFFVVSEEWKDQEVQGLSYSALGIRYEMKDSYTFTKIPVTVKTLDKVLEEVNLTSPINFVTIDTEGWELEVMKGFNVAKYQPPVIMLENYLHMKEYTEYMESVGYKLNKVLSHNYIYELKT